MELVEAELDDRGEENNINTTWGKKDDTLAYAVSSEEMKEGTFLSFQSNTTYY